VFLESTSVFTLHFFTNSGGGSESKRTKNVLMLENVSRKLPSAAPCAKANQTAGARGRGGGGSQDWKAFAHCLLARG
jgi:hypothetical protein